MKFYYKWLYNNVLVFKSFKDADEQSKNNSNKTQQELQHVHEAKEQIEFETLEVGKINVFLFMLFVGNF